VIISDFFRIITSNKAYTLNNHVRSPIQKSSIKASFQKQATKKNSSQDEEQNLVDKTALHPNTKDS
jgi:hypothetical protein